MKMLVITYRDKDLSQFKAPMAINCSDEQEFVRDVRNGLLKAYNAETANKFIAQELYLIGEYDDQEAIIKGLTPKKLIDCDELLIQRKEIAKKAKEVEIE